MNGAYTSTSLPTTGAQPLSRISYIPLSKNHSEIRTNSVPKNVLENLNENLTEKLVHTAHLISENPSNPSAILEHHHGNLHSSPNENTGDLNTHYQHLLSIRFLVKCLCRSKRTIKMGFTSSRCPPPEGRRPRKRK